jgi:hypothetical protein
VSKHGMSRRHFFHGSLLAGAIPIGGFGSVVSLKTLTAARKGTTRHTGFISILGRQAKGFPNWEGLLGGKYFCPFEFGSYGACPKQGAIQLVKKIFI